MGPDPRRRAYRRAAERADPGVHRLPRGRRRRGDRAGGAERGLAPADVQASAPGAPWLSDGPRGREPEASAVRRQRLLARAARERVRATGLVFSDRIRCNPHVRDPLWARRPHAGHACRAAGASHAGGGSLGGQNYHLQPAAVVGRARAGDRAGLVRTRPRRFVARGGAKLGGGHSPNRTLAGLSEGRARGGKSPCGEVVAVRGLPHGDRIARTGERGAPSRRVGNRQPGQQHYAVRGHDGDDRGGLRHRPVPVPKRNQSARLAGRHLADVGRDRCRGWRIHPCDSPRAARGRRFERIRGHGRTRNRRPELRHPSRVRLLSQQRWPLPRRALSAASRLLWAIGSRYYCSRRPAHCERYAGPFRRRLRRRGTGAQVLLLPQRLRRLDRERPPCGDEGSEQTDRRHERDDQGHIQRALA